MPPAPAMPQPGAAGGVGRAGWRTISRQHIIDTALTALRHGAGYEQMTIGNLAASIGVAPMSLYRHLRDNDDLLDEIVDRLMVWAWRPQADQGDWKAWTAEAADRLRHFLVIQPAALHVYLRHPVVSATAMARMEAMMAVLRHAVGDEQAARRAYAAIHTYTVGFAALEASRAGWVPCGDGGPPATEPASEIGPTHHSGSDTGHVAEHLAAYTTPRQFAEGLYNLLDGIEHDARPHQNNPEASPEPGPTGTARAVAGAGAAQRRHDRAQRYRLRHRCRRSSR